MYSSSNSDVIQLFSDHQLRMQGLICYILPRFLNIFDISKLDFTTSNHFLSLEHLIDLLHVVYRECKSGTCKKDESSIRYIEQLSDDMSCFSQFQISMKDFDPIKLIGHGAFGEVHLVRYRANSMVINIIYLFFDVYIFISGSICRIQIWWIYILHP